MADDFNLPSSNRDLTPQEFLRLKNLQTELRRRKRVLEGAKTYLGERAEPALLIELEEVQQKIKDISTFLKSSEGISLPLGSQYYRAPDPYVENAVDAVGRANLYLDREGADYIPLEEAGTLEINYNGPTPSLNDFSIFNLELNLLINDIAFFLIRDYADPEHLRRLKRDGIVNTIWYPATTSFPYKRSLPYIRVPLIITRIDSIRTGSFDEFLSFTLLPLLAHPDVRSVLQNLVANVIWVIGGKIGGKIRGELIKPKLPVPQVDIGPNLRDAIIGRSQRGYESLLIELVQEVPDGSITRLNIQSGYHDPEITMTTHENPLLPLPPKKIKG